MASKHNRDVLRLIEPMMTEAGGRCWLEHGGRPHPRLYIELDGRQRFVVLSCSPRDPGALTYETQKRVHKLLREMKETP